MSQENAELFRRIFESANLAEMETILPPLLARDFRIDNTPTAITDKTYQGVAGCLEWREDMSDGFADGARYGVEAILADPDDFVVGRVAIVGTGARSGAPLHLRWTAVMWFRDGKATHAAGYANRRQALESVGLRE